uniref:BD-FAE-like domain-containing protein n=1 Tax=Palpitomonas bilix TaxID=652834 RepID=A0A7S3G557_9EUKA|mmetsp:Transcript_22637/g.57702  ORF Transcript_22637/g.57702 Transcript_22637/m.57702 type:complete len:333 (+) Transcript_22637:169-1167(+)
MAPNPVALVREAGKELAWGASLVPHLIETAGVFHGQHGPQGKNIRYGKSKRAFLDVYLPSGRVVPAGKEGYAGLPVVVFFHGGGWGFGFKGFNALMGRALADRGLVAVLPSYTLYPSGNMEDLISDVSDAIVWTQEHISAFGGDPSQIHLSGHSAGAHLVTMCALRAMRLDANATSKMLSSSFLSIIGICGVYHLAEHELHEQARGVDSVSPMRFAAGGRNNFSKYSPTVILEMAKRKGDTSTDAKEKRPVLCLIHALDDRTVPLASSRRFAVAAQNSRAFQKVLLQSVRGGHTDNVNPSSKSQREAFEKTVDIISLIAHSKGKQLQLKSKL